MLRLTLIVLLLSSPGLVAAMPPGNQAKTKATVTVLPVAKAQPVQIHIQRAPALVKAPGLKAMPVAKKTRALATPLGTGKLESRFPVRSRTTRVVRERPLIAPHALRSLGLQLEIYEMQANSLR